MSFLDEQDEIVINEAAPFATCDSTPPLAGDAIQEAFTAILTHPETGEMTPFHCRFDFGGENEEIRYVHFNDDWRERAARVGLRHDVASEYYLVVECQRQWLMKRAAKRRQEVHVAGLARVASGRGQR